MLNCHVTSCRVTMLSCHNVVMLPIIIIVTAKGRKATIVVRVGNNRPDLGVNPICNR